MEQMTFDKIKNAILDLQKAGQPINHAAFITWLDQLAKDEPALREYRIMKHANDLAYNQAKFESRNSRYRQKLEFSKSMFEAVMNTAVSSLKSALIINGGATIAMLGYLSTILKENKDLAIPYEYSQSMLIYATGVFLAATANASTYFAQYYYQNQTNSRAEKFRASAIILVGLSLLAFITGSYWFYSAL